MQYGAWTVVGDKIKGSDGVPARLPCRCACGAERDVRVDALRQNKSVSCGCSVRHGNKKRLEYGSWAAMKQRCDNSNHMHWQHYGGRGIKYCSRWQSFANFLEDMGACPVGRTLDRINVNGNYEPSNCRWATASEQRRNQRRAM